MPAFPYYKIFIVKYIKYFFSNCRFNILKGRINK